MSTVETKKSNISENQIINYQKMNLIEYRKHLDNTYFHNLKYSAFSFLFPSLLCYYMGKYDLFIIQFITWITSILRWNYTTNVYYQYLDHNYVKLVFISLIYYCYRSFSFDKDIYFYFYILGLLHVVVIYFFSWYLFNLKNNKNVIFHMIVHCYTCVGFIVSPFLLKSYY
mgnify:CR=1 FL=1